MSITPITGWALNRIVQMDEHHPGIAGHVLRASAERRQVVAAFLSVSRPHAEFSCDDERGSFLIHATHDAILRAAYGAVPSGLRRALGRAGPTPHPRRFYLYLYLYLYALLSSPGQQAFDKILGRMPAIHLDRLRIARVLRPICCAITSSLTSPVFRTRATFAPTFRYWQNMPSTATR